MPGLPLPEDICNPFFVRFGKVIFYQINPNAVAAPPSNPIKAINALTGFTGLSGTLPSLNITTLPVLKAH